MKTPQRVALIAVGIVVWLVATVGIAYAVVEWQQPDAGPRGHQGVAGPPGPVGPTAEPDYCSAALESLQGVGGREAIVHQENVERFCD